MAVPSVQAMVRRTHEERVLDVLRERAGLSRAEIAARVGLSRTTLSEITSSLIARGAVVVVDTDGDRRTGSGRRAELLALDPRSGQYLGVDLAHSRALVVIADAAHEVIASGVEAYDAALPWHDMVAVGIRLAESVAAGAGLHFGALQGVAVGVVGTDAATRAAAHAGFADHFGVPVVTDNNTRFAALAEAMAAGAADGAPSELVYLRVSEGIGGGLVVGGRLVSGGRGAAGELGHVRVAGAEDLECRCGGRGCLEAVASTRALCRSAGVTTVHELRAALAAADPAAVAAAEDATRAIASVLASAAIMISPERIVIGGTVPTILPDLVDRVREQVRTELAGIGGGVPDVAPAVLGDDDGAVGAIAALVQRSPLLAGYPAPVDAPAPEPRSLRA